ncbi:uncharacterized protein IL334_002126 [Kwoniella shivajii]|uniref:Uncharacterized protein n=1 Tax=Kwoniella shivajii TaxID=564305 RepID=A0ABZ1CTU6_9TREE|nr:hypothetical protein IL334_002126 [Kwoniella shivajii]
MSIHPFFVDQTPYLPVASSSKTTIYPLSSIYTLPNSSATHSRTNSSASINTLASETSITSNAFSRSTPIDTNCLRWMQNELDSDHIFGSVADRGKSLSIEEREVRRRAMESQNTELAGEETEESNFKAIKAERRKGKVGKWFH